MNCNCGRRAVFDGKCAVHFTQEFELRVKKTIEEYGLLRPGDCVAVAVSGGKDSLTVLSLLRRWHGNVTAIAIDEGIPGYRDETLRDAQTYCDTNDIPIIISSFKELTGKPLSEMSTLSNGSPCSVCGTYRRHLLNREARGFDVLATGHNADDESQALLMNLIKGNTALLDRCGPANADENVQGFTRRVKPLYFCTEREVAAYAFLHKLSSGFVECPNASMSYRGAVRDELNRYAQSRPDAKRALLQRFLALQLRVHNPLATPREHLKLCTRCAEPASGELCAACRITERLEKQQIVHISRR